MLNLITEEIKENTSTTRPIIEIKTEKATYVCTPTHEDKYAVSYDVKGRNSSDVRGLLFFDNPHATFVVQWVLEFDKSVKFL